MNRLQKKCLIATAGLHLLLVLVLLFGSAFFTRHSQPDETQLLDVIPSTTIDAVFNSGVKAAQPPAPMPVVQLQPPAPQPPPPPQPKPVVQPPTLVEKVQEFFKPEPKKLSPDDLKPIDPIEKPIKPTPKKISLTPVVRRTPVADTADADAEKAAAKQARDRAKAFARALTSISKSATAATEIDMPGNSSASYANYGAVVVSIYHHAWTPPDSMVSETAVVRFAVTISRDGSVVSARIITSSGDRSVDDAVQRMLNRVSFIHEFPEGTKDRQRTYNIDFNATRTNSQ